MKLVIRKNVLVGKSEVGQSVRENADGAKRKDKYDVFALTKQLMKTIVMLVKSHQTLKNAS
jgi:hypothetical protein